MSNSTPATKRCSRCETSKSAAEFHKRVRSKDGLAAWCKPCTTEYGNQWRTKNADKLREQGKAHWLANKERLSAQRTARWKADPEHRASRLADAKRRYEGNLEAERARRRAWREANPDRLNAYSVAWQKANPERAREIQREYKRRHPETYQLRRAVKAGAELGAIDPAALWDGLCALCGESIDESCKYPDPMSRSLDHIVPIARGGVHAQENLQWTHLVCNKRKGASMPD